MIDLEEAVKCAGILTDSKFDLKDDNIRKAFGKWAVKYHPDKNPAANATAIYQAVSNCVDYMRKSPNFVTAVRYHAGVASSSEIVSTYMMYIFDTFFDKGAYLLLSLGGIMIDYVFVYLMYRLVQFLFYTALALLYKVGSVPAWIKAKLTSRKSLSKRSRNRSALSKRRTSGLKSRSRSAGRRQRAVSRSRRRQSSTKYKVTPKGQQAATRLTTKLLSQYEKDTKRRS